MGNLYRYSAISTKLRAMRRQLIPDSAFRELAHCGTVPDIIRSLEEYPQYQEIFLSVDPETLHRDELERLLLTDQYADFLRLYRFADGAQRKCLDLELMRFETVLLKRCLRCLFGQLPALDLSHFHDFFLKHGNIDFSRVTAAKSFDEFTEALHGSRYAAAFQALSGNTKVQLLDCETALDIWHFRTVWHIAQQGLSKEDAAFFCQMKGAQIDLLNLQWIRRAKLYYHMTAEQIRPLLIPLRGRLRRGELEHFLSTDTEAAFLSALHDSAYRRDAAALSSDIPDMEVLCNTVLDHLCRLAIKKEPYSCAVIFEYLRAREEEIKRIISVTEAVRYGLSPEETVSDILKLDHRRSFA